MATIREGKKELHRREWAEDITECQNSSMKIAEWCQMKGISINTYYRRLRAVRNALLTKTEQAIVPLSIAAESTELETNPTVTPPAKVQKQDKVIIRKDGMEIELPQDTPEQMLLTLLRGLREC
jgi:hypothetical protein